MINTLAICAVLVYGIYVLDKRAMQIITLLVEMSAKTQKDMIYVRGPSDIESKPEIIKNQTVSVTREPEEFSSAISRASTVRGFGNM